MRFEGFNEFFKFGVPLSAEAADEGIFQKFVDPESLLATFFASLLAYLPSVIIKGYGAVAEALLTNGIEIAADRFGP